MSGYITGCKIKNNRFVNEKGVWNKSVFYDLNVLYKIVERHIMSRTYLEKKLFEKTRLEQDPLKKLQVSQHHELVFKNRHSRKVY